MQFVGAHLNTKNVQRLLCRWPLAQCANSNKLAHSQTANGVAQAANPTIDRSVDTQVAVGLRQSCKREGQKKCLPVRERVRNAPPLAKRGAYQQPSAMRPKVE